jgi:DNA helicase-2/ATP-dependent DNA helicase PcrA
MHQSNVHWRSIDKHQQAFEKLNAKQQEAVTQIEGPVMVLAGPGTGKTEVLAIRIGHILKKQDVYPSNILCLTYSSAAVEAMRSRLLSLIGPAANEIAIYTYHSFCNKQINENASDTFKNRSLITDAQRHMLVEKMIYDHLSPRERKYLKPASSTRINDLIKIFSTLKQEGITKDRLVEIAERCIEDDLPLEEKYLLKKGGLNVKGRELKERIEKFATEIAEMYADYTDQLERRNKYEFEDMLIEGVLLLEKDQALSTRLQEQYQYILVDEFQDTNLKQLALISHLCSNVMEPNIFVVGDDDQCIYRFQGANKYNFTWTRNRFPRLQTIVLDINYRSTAVILQESFGLISKNSDRQPEKNQPLTAGNINYQDIKHKPVVRVYEDSQQEAYSVAKHIFEHSNKQYGGTAILARKHKEFDLLKYWLGFHKIPYKTNRNWINLFDTNFGKCFHYLLQFARSYEENNYVADGF